MPIDGTLERNVTTEPSDALRGRVTVPWLTVVPLAVVMAYADGFWMTSLRGAVGAIERTQGPFVTWLRESSLVLPVFVCAVLGALALAMHWFGPVLRTSRAILATALLIVAAGTLVGILELAASSAYDYHLQSTQLQMVNSMAPVCAAGSCLAQQQQASLALQVRAVGYGSAILLVTNLVAVGWAVAMRGGRLKITSSRQGMAATRLPRSRVDALRLLLAFGLIGSAVIHSAVVPTHLTEWGAAGAFFIVLAVAEVGIGALLVARLQPPVLFAAAAASVGPLALWLYSRTIGIPFGPGAGIPEPVGLADLAACLLELSTLVIAVVLMRGRGWLGRRPPLTAHSAALTLVAVVAIAAIGLAGSGLPWFDDFGGSGDQPAMSSPH